MPRFLCYDDGMTIPPPLKTVHQAAALLNVRAARVRELIRLGKLPAEHHPTSYRWTIRPNDLKKYLKVPRPRGRPLKALEKK